jgi:hypothetical protein
VTWISNTCGKQGKGDDLCAYIDWVGRHRQKEEDKDKRKGTEDLVVDASKAKKEKKLKLEVAAWTGATGFS